MNYHVDLESNNCSGCTACYSICPVSAITMEEDLEGFLIPKVDNKKCISCSKCINVCSAYSKININQKAFSSFAFQNQDFGTLKNSSSGAFFPAIANYILEKGGYVCGCVFDSDFVPIHIVSKNKNDIVLMQDSKYVQSNLNDCFKYIRDILEKEIPVLFTGTSCQVSGLKRYLHKEKVDDRRLLTIDFFCHGVPSPKVWKEYLEFYEIEKKAIISAFRFRNKKYGWGEKSRGTYHLNTVIRKNKIIKKDDISLIARMWYTIFFSNYCLRSYCYKCPFASVDKPADFTMADFWGIEDITSSFDNGKGCSLVIVRNKLALKILYSLKNVKLEQINLNKAIEKQGNAFIPTKRPIERDKFWDDYQNNGFKFIAKKYFRYDWIHKIKDLLHRICFELHMTNLYK